MRGQSKTESLVESILNVSIGFFLSLLVWVFIVIPIWDLEVTMMDNLAITALFTIISIARGYAVRRFFNAGLHKLATTIVGGLCRTDHARK